MRVTQENRKEFENRKQFENRMPPAGNTFMELALSTTGSIILIPLIAILLIFALVFITGKTPGRALYFFFIGPFRNVYNLGNMVNSAIPLLLGGLGVSVAMKTGSMNLGGEGQIYTGAFTTTVTALALANFGLAGGITAVLAGMLAAGLACALSGALKAWWNTNELITTFLVSNILLRVVNFMVNGPFLDPETNLQATRKIGESLRLPRILQPSNLSAALYIALAVLLVTHIFLYRTKRGYEFRMAGANEIFARYGGINTKVNTLLAMFISGALYGMAGGLAVTGTYYGTVKDFSDGLGWNGLAAALIARFYPPALIPASLFFAWIGSGAKIAMQNSEMTFESAFIVQALVFFLATSPILGSLFKHRKRIQKQKEAR
ncbi:MAG: ABC transporter permease [Treponema sp.]|nr:ABC transporter permease [Treponema sp.]